VKNCDEHNVCDHLSKRLVDGGKGFKALHTVKRDSNETRFLGVAYKTSAKDKGLLLNWCPWCGGKPGYFECDKAMPANADVTGLAPEGDKS